MYLAKSYFFLLFFFTVANILAQEPHGWTKLKSPTNETLRRLFFVDENNGWAVSLGGKIINTTDSGNNWNIQNSTVTFPIVDIFFINPSKGWAITYPSEPPFGTSILKTTNGRLQWVKDSILFVNEIFSTIFFFDENNGLLGGNGIKKTTDGGLTWKNSFIEPGGVSTLPINIFSFYSKTFGYASGGRIDIAGVSWDYKEQPFFGVAFAVDFLDDKEGWSAAGYKFLSTNDSGKTWIEEFIFDSTIVYDLQFVNKYTGFACAQDGALLKFTSFKKPLVNKPTFELYNYPNPFTEKTYIEFTVLSPDFDIPTKAKLKLYDILGNEIATLYEDEFRWGRYGYEFNPLTENLNLSSGVYLLTITSGDVNQSIKILYLK